ncbi:MAG TPA: diacylglycerol kinase family protein [Acidimicrobiales bacterium]|jgi:diacylglycerol kinase family enzyme|nr:diacylglycerol kinase family protein [Acidimicrobiales bacterium]MDP6280319.1 diacylglycerol kinase family protein [Acidimicrobiales bacterium]MDP7117938.1 diacylglycerol kinase family protein [Acidimicrobiales bacterium]MDP7410196.1 diacylglycerol kinase family protein [Acidimicrobiales bacterium]MEE1521975.1 diacylglycerol kinase family protein [Acidimicrobiales bacterium]|tara:strand:+ start:13765 stop:14730 length:966 start_codon:yes stop_codon:yes gene_type:complete
MKVLLVVNPSASSVNARTRTVIQKALSADHRLEVATTSRRGHATRLARGAADDGMDVVVVLGGDGTLNEAANGLAGSDTALAAVPGGSTNVFAHILGLPDDPVEATGAALDAMEAGSIRRIGLGSVNDRYFLFNAGVGFDAAVVEQIEQRGGLLKRFAGHPLFIAAACNTWLQHFDRRQPAFQVTTRRVDEEALGDAVTTGVDGMFGVCLNTDPYTYLGSRSLSLSPSTNLDSPLAMVTMQSLSLASLVPVLTGALGFGRTPVAECRGISHRSNLAEIHVAGYRPVQYQVDGDYLGEATDLTFRHQPAAMDLVVPLEPPAA